MGTIEFEEEVGKRISIITKLLTYVLGQSENINLSQRIRTLRSIGLSQSNVSSIIKKPLIIVKIMDKKEELK